MGLVNIRKQYSEFSRKFAATQNNSAVHLCQYKVTLPMVTNSFGTFQFGTVWQEKRGGKRKSMKFKANCQKMEILKLFFNETNIVF